MKHLLGVNVLLAAIWENHPQYQAATDWLGGKSILLCPLAELGFLRVSTQPKAINAPMDKARELLEKFAATHQAQRIDDDLPALAFRPAKSVQITYLYLADLANKHGARLGTFDTEINHPAAEAIR